MDQSVQDHHREQTADPLKGRCLFYWFFFQANPAVIEMGAI